MTGQDVINVFNRSGESERRYNEHGEHVSIPVLVDGVESSISITLRSQIQYLVWGASHEGSRPLMAMVHFTGSVTRGAEWLESVQLR